jgi:phosphate transport system substrate-binding protein
VPEVVRITGSDTMLVLGRRLAESFMRTHPGIAVVVEGGGTGVGVEALIQGEAEICAASRPLQPTEIEALHEHFGTLGVRFLVAQDAISVFVNPGNPVRDLEMAQLAALFSGAATSWSEVGGPDLPVVVVLRPPSSGTHRFFRTHVLGGGSFTPAGRTVLRTVDVLELVAAERGAVGYGGIAFGQGVVRCRIGGVAPLEREVREGRYPLSRYLHLYTTAPPEGATRQVVDWCLGPEGQRVVREVGFIPLWEW